MMTRSLSLTRYERDKLCIWGVNPLEKEILARNGIRLSYIVHDNKRAAELLGGSNHRYSELVNMVHEVRQTDGSQPAPVNIPLTTLTMMAPVNLNTDIGLASMGFMVIGWFVVGLRPKDRQFFFQELAELLRLTVGAEGDSFEHDSDRLDQRANIMQIINNTLDRGNKLEWEFIPIVYCVAEAISKTLFATPRPALEFLYKVAIPLTLADGSMFREDSNNPTKLDHSTCQSIDITVVPVLQVTNLGHILQVKVASDGHKGFADWEQPPKGASKGRDKRETDYTGFKTGDILSADIHRVMPNCRFMKWKLVGVVIDRKTRNRNTMTDVDFFEVLVVPHNSGEGSYSFHRFWEYG
jgi:hypothetical protein